MPGREVVILGSGDIGLIMAGRLTLEVWQGDVLVASVKKPKALPAEMVQLKIKKEKLTGKGGLEVKAVC